MRWALGRLVHRSVGLIGGAGHGRADEHGIDELAGPARELLGGAADELGEDHPRVAARAEQSGASDRVDDLLAADLVDRPPLRRGGEPVELGDDGAEGEDHVVAGVAVGDGEHVEVVDLLAAGLKLGQRGLYDGSEADKDRVGQPTPANDQPLARLGYFAGLQAAGAHVDAAGSAGVVDAHSLEVRIEAPPRGHHRVATVVAESGTLRAYVTDLGHRWASIRGIG
jgi:hypothetical protein